LQGNQLGKSTSRENFSNIQKSKTTPIRTSINHWTLYRIYQKFYKPYLFRTSTLFRTEKL